jgi:hypothetical protein
LAVEFQIWILTYGNPTFQLVKPTTAAKANCPAYKNYEKTVRASMQANWTLANGDLAAYLKNHSGFETIDFDAIDTINGASEAEVMFHKELIEKFTKQLNFSAFTTCTNRPGLTPIGKTPARACMRPFMNWLAC